MNTLPAILGALCVYAIAYRYYSAFVAAKVLALDDRRTTPAHTLKMDTIMFRRRSCAVRASLCSDCGAGPLLGRHCAQFGFARDSSGSDWRGAGWLRARFMVLVASVRHGGRSWRR